MAAERNIDIRVRLKGADQVARGMKTVNNSFGTMGKWLDVTKGLLGANFIQNSINKIVSELGDAVDASVDFESALAGVAKTTDFSDVGLKNFGNELMYLSERIPTTAADLAALAETAGQLGIAESDLLSFTEIVAAMGESTNLSAEEAAVAFARIANIFGTKSSDFERLGSVVVDLGNNFATTESEIVNMAQNMSGMGSLAGMSESDVMAFAAALSSVGIEAEAGGSAMQKLFAQFQKASLGDGGFNTIAKIAGKTEDAFAALWESDPAKAIEEFLTGLGKIESEGGSALTVLDELGIKEVRLTRSVLGLASAEGLLSAAIKTSRNAWSENTALAEEAGKRYATTASRMQMAQNRIDNASITVGDGISDTVVGYKELIGDFAKTVTENARDIDLAKIVKKANKEYEAQKGIIDENAKIARQLADNIAQLGAPENLDAAGLQSYRSNMQALIAIMPELNKLWNSETMNIEGGTNALYANIDAVQQLSTAEAEYKKNSESADAYLIEEQALEALRTQLVIAEAEYSAADKAYKEFWNNATAAGMSDLEIEWGSEEYTKRLSEASAEVTRLDKAVTESEENLAEYAYIVDDFETSADGVVAGMGAVASAAEGVSDAQKMAANGLATLEMQLDEAIIKFEETKAAISETLDGIVGGFEKIELPEIEAPETVNDALQSQLDFLAKYSEALAKAQEMGVSEDILADLTDGTQEDYQTLAAIVSGTEEDVATINAKFAEVSAAKETLATELATAQTGLAATVEGITQMANDLVSDVDVSSEMYSTGAKNIQSLINGINAKISSLRLKVSTVKNLTSQLTETNTPKEVDGSHAAGLQYVPNDGYIAQLHRGEMVLTALEAKAYRAEQYANYAMPSMLETSRGVSKTYNQHNTSTVNLGGVVINSEQDPQQVIERIAAYNKKRARGRGQT